MKGFEEKSFLETHASGRQPVSIRINPFKFNIQDLSFDHEEKVPWSSDGYYLRERPSFTLDPLFHAGAYYVQEASSMFLEQAIKQSCDLSKPLRVLDLCAAPGGKSTLIQSIISEESLLVSNEIIKARANILAENITKWGAANVIVTNNEPAHFKRLPHFFDVIVVDAPCSGSGLFRKDPGAIDEWSLQNVELCSQRQQTILRDVMPALKPGGILIYSTCSYSQKEDEEIADWIVSQFEAKSVSLDIRESWGIVETISSENKTHGYRFYPDKLKGEGFFIAAFKKATAVVVTKEIKPKNKSVLLNKLEVEVIHKYIKHAEKYTFIKWQEEVLAFPATMMDAFLLLQSVLYFKKAGVKIGTLIRSQLIPDPEWALSLLASSFLPTLDVDLQTALQYLRKKEVELNTDIRGWAIISYKNSSLGLVKILAGRTNNYYPKEWRILNM
ncbi:MAG: RNA methyltransferase [Gloeobacteraceae cyanobacterium ES-bin-316]|nr:RNA methyltransferase [Ferruginibacter sp.]